MKKKETRIAVVSSNKCKPGKCHLECKNNCPVVRMGKLCIEVSSFSQKSIISESLCVGCGICIKKCPYQAIKIENFPKELNETIVHQFNINSFRLFRLPIPKQGKILGVVGNNGIGKSTAIKILSGKLQANLGNFSKPLSWKDIIKNFRGSELQKYFELLSKEKIKVLIKPQFVDSLSENLKSSLEEVFLKKTLDHKKLELLKNLSLEYLLEKKIEQLSGGELQRFSIATVVIQDADVYLFDEITSYLDIKQRIEVARVIRNLVYENDKIFIIIIEHDLAIIDYLSDYICCLYGKSGVYGIVTLPYTVKEGINIFLAGFIPAENLRFRETSIKFIGHKNNFLNDKHQESIIFKYPQIEKNFESFRLLIEPGEIFCSEIIVLLGENGSGKTSFVKLIGGMLKPDKHPEYMTKLRISYKPQKIFPTYSGTVKKLLFEKLGNSFFNLNFKEKILNPLKIENLLEKKVENLSGGELQRVGMVLCLGKNSEIYLIDEPSAYLDLEQRLNVSKIIKNFIFESKKASFVVEHDFMIANFLGNRVIVFEGKPSIFCSALSPSSIGKGMNSFLKDLEITFRKDPVNFRPRINKLNSLKDKEQKKKGNYYFSG